MQQAQQGSVVADSKDVWRWATNGIHISGDTYGEKLFCEHYKFWL